MSKPVAIRPIRSETDYEGALGEVEQLWGARTGTPEGDRLDVLATLINVYETERYDPPPQRTLGHLSRCADQTSQTGRGGVAKRAL